MADPPPFPNRGPGRGTETDRGPATSTPRWVKVFGTIAAVLVVLVVIMLLAGHGPGRHHLGAEPPHPGATNGYAPAIGAPGADVPRAGTVSGGVRQP